MDWKAEVAEFGKGLKVEAPGITPQAMRFGLFGSVGSGKSVTAGIFAMSITPAPALIGWVDGENHRSGWAIDSLAQLAAKHYPGTTVDQHKARFKVVYMEPPFHPLRVLAGLEALEKQGCKCVILDVISQAWDSDGGYLDLKNDEVERMLNANQNTTEAKVQSAAAAHVKPWTHAKMVNRINNSPGSVILCIQAKKKFNMDTKRPMEYESPIQESGLTRTVIACGLVEADQDGKGGLVDFTNLKAGCKFTHPDLLKLLPARGQRFTFEHGEAVAKWCSTPQTAGRPAPTSAPTTTAPAATPAATPTPAAEPVPPDGTKAVKMKLWKLLKPIEAGDLTTWGTRIAWLRANGIITAEDELNKFTVEQLLAVIEQTTTKITTGQV